LVGRGVKQLEAVVVSCRPRQNVKVWLKLERALLSRFRDIYHEQPFCNVQGNSGRFRWTAELGRLFNQRRIDAILRKFE
jgi:hypothetical protein